MRPGTVPPRAEEAQGDLIHVYKYLRGSVEDRDWIYPAVPSGRTRGHRHKLECRRVPLHVRKHFPLAQDA